MNNLLQFPIFRTGDILLPGDNPASATGCTTVMLPYVGQTVGVMTLPYVDINANQASGDIKMKAETFRLQVVRPALKVTDLWSQSAENLLVATALVETNLDCLLQEGGGPGLGMYQCESATYLDVVKYIQIRQPNLGRSILSACYLDMFPPAEALTWNLRLQTLICRMHYYRRPERLPDAQDAEEMYRFYSDFYNCGGKATHERDIPLFQLACQNG